MRILGWLLFAVVVWQVLVYFLSRSRTWAALALFSERVSYGARSAYNITKKRELEREAEQASSVKRSSDPLPNHDDVIDAVSLFLRRQRERGA